jgi:hypothetical protein
MAQVLPEVTHEKLPGLLDSFATSARQRQILQVKRPEVSLDLAGPRWGTAKSLLGAATQSLGERFQRQSPPRAHCFRAQLAREMHVLLEELIERREGCFFLHEFGQVQVF